MDFSKALVDLKDGMKVSRSGWNGKGMYIYLDHNLSTYYQGFEQILEPCVVMFTAQGRLQLGWLASQADILADDWESISE